MTKHQKILCFNKESKDSIYNYKTGITKRLLEKYKPSLGFKIIDGGKRISKEKKAA